MEKKCSAAEKTGCSCSELVVTAVTQDVSPLSRQVALQK